MTASNRVHTLISEHDAAIRGDDGPLMIYFRMFGIKPFGAKEPHKNGHVVGCGANERLVVLDYATQDFSDCHGLSEDEVKKVWDEALDQGLRITL